MSNDIINIDNYTKDSAIAKYIRSTLFINGMKYNHDKKKFEPESPLSTIASRNRVEAECFREFGIGEENRKSERVLRAIDDLIDKVLKTTNFEPVSLGQQKSIRPHTIPIFQHIMLEENFAQTSLLSMGEGRFLVISTNRNTLKEGDIIEAIKTPWNIHSDEGVDFHIYREGEEYIPSQLPRKLDEDIDFVIEYRFMTKSLDAIIYLVPADINIVIDENTIEKEHITSVKTINSFTEARAFVEEIISLVQESGFEGEFYKRLRSFSLQFGVSSYTLNLLIEMIDNSRESTIGIYSAEDWQSNIPVEVQEEMERQRIERAIADVKRLKKQYLDKLKAKIEQKKFLFFFKRSGSFSRKSEEELKGISDKLDAYAEEGLCEAKWAQGEKNDFLKKYKVETKDNIRTGIKLGVFLILIIGATIITLQTKKGLEAFTITKEQGVLAISEKRFTEARQYFDKALEEYQPAVTSLIAKIKYNALIGDLEKAIDEEVMAGVNQINAWLEADNGHFKEHTLERLRELYTLRPEDERLNELKNKWNDQY